MRLWGHSVLGAALLAINAAQAQDIANGKVIAEVWCGNCHRVDTTDPRPVRDATPSFATIARKKSTTAASLATFLQTRHRGMPDLTLSRDEINDVSAYLLSLRGAP